MSLAGARDVIVSLEARTLAKSCCCCESNIVYLSEARSCCMSLHQLPREIEIRALESKTPNRRTLEADHGTGRVPTTLCRCFECRPSFISDVVINYHCYDARMCISLCTRILSSIVRMRCKCTFGFAPVMLSVILFLPSVTAPSQPLRYRQLSVKL
jgi:hypothetical protein